MTKSVVWSELFSIFNMLKINAANVIAAHPSINKRDTFSDLLLQPLASVGADLNQNPTSELQRKTDI